MSCECTFGCSIKGCKGTCTFTRDENTENARRKDPVPEQPTSVGVPNNRRRTSSSNTTRVDGSYNIQNHTVSGSVQKTTEDRVSEAGDQPQPREERRRSHTSGDRRHRHSNSRR
ncbi:uncharacterized protein FOMMEDRAFT_151578 [Fomitiporia mediterranea MF3/22]|uniref:uncharacterized protein n=1 Tax=Fomitiporia mediterranea (strain MF3/22) TaxID=694068 RepID=UPI0004409446|nr:uncharacterized protein FOMMEDRAFT_151578 [Fomitiporia mediterranea MF3/22]EJD06338.1 hypothetical protein FOMMEDRAFT_151578 [Fomitiporia mediterranea MF3/22]